MMVEALASLVLLLAQACVAEVGFPSDTSECHAMWHINAVKVDYDLERMTFQVQEYNSIFRRSPRGAFIVQSERAQWVRALRADGDEPEGWPSDLKWSVPWHRGRWMGVLAAAERFPLAARSQHPIPEATHYGGDCEVSAGACDHMGVRWVRVRVPATWRQAYWRRARVHTISAEIASGRSMR